MVTNGQKDVWIGLTILQTKSHASKGTAVSGLTRFNRTVPRMYSGSSVSSFACQNQITDCIRFYQNDFMVTRMKLKVHYWLSNRGTFPMKRRWVENKNKTNLYNDCKIDNKACNITKDEADDTSCHRWRTNIHINLHAKRDRR